MNIYLAAILKIIVLGALFGLLVASSFLDRDPSSRVRHNFSVVFGMVAVLALYAYYNFGAFHWRGPLKLVQPNEQFHFYLGANYLKEVRYDGLYLAAMLAAKEDRMRVGDWTLRDPMSFRMERAKYLETQARRVKQRFSAERWDRFRSDWRFFFERLGVSETVLRDHGNTGSPAWAVPASLLTRLLGTGPTAANVYAVADQILLLALFIAMWRCFGARAACIAIGIGLLPPKVFDYLGGSLLRLDWLFALGVSACCLRVGRHKTSGVFLGLAIASKIFCGLVALALGLRFVIETVRERRLHRAHVELVLAAVGGLGAAVLLSAMVFGGFDIWTDFLQRLLATYQEKWYYTNHSFRDLFLQAAHSGMSVFDWTPAQIAARLPEVDIADYALSFLLVRLGIVAAFCLVIARHETVFAFGVGVLFVFVVLATHMYYWQMLALLALVCADRYREDVRKLLYLLFLCAFLMAEYVFVRFSELKEWQGYFGSYWLGMLCCLMLLVEVASTARVRRLLAKLLPA